VTSLFAGELSLQKPDFEKILLEAVDEGFTCLGNAGKETFYFHLEKSFAIKKNEIPQKTEEFVKALERIFGEGAQFLEALITGKLEEKMQNSGEPPTRHRDLKDFFTPDQHCSPKTERVNTGATSRR